MITVVCIVMVNCVMCAINTTSQEESVASVQGVSCVMRWMKWLRSMIQKPDWRNRNKLKGLCFCGRELIFGYKTCATCRNKSREYTYKNHAEVKRRHKEAYYRDHEKNLLKRRHYGMKLRNEVLSAYGSCCTCCGETVKEFLQIDHINNDGAKHRKAVGNYIYNWLKQNNYPQGFRLLCANCNWSRGVYGHCPHEKVNDSETRVL